MPVNREFEILVRNRKDQPFQFFIVKVRATEDVNLDFETARYLLFQKGLMVTGRGINGVVFTRRDSTERKETSMKILILEDDEAVQRTFSHALRGHELLQANNLEQAGTFFLANFQTISVVVVDGCVENKSKKFDTEPFIRQVLASGFKGSIIAISGDEDVRKDMLKVGCTDECEKHELANKLKELGLI